MPGPMTGDRDLGVKASPKRLASTRIANRVGCAAPPFWLRKGRSLLVMTILILVFVALSALRKTACARGFWKATVFLSHASRKRYRLHGCTKISYKTVGH